jgi:branched-chain amino acid transport system permease protein
MRTAVFHESFRAEERLWDSTTQRRWMLGFTLVLFTLPLWGSDYMLAMACIVGIHVIATLGLNLTTGNAGLISLATVPSSASAATRWRGWASRACPSS